MIEVTSPTRVDLAGGTMDLWPLWAMMGNACTINMSISIFTHCHLQPRDDERIFIESLDFNKTWEFDSLSSLLNDESKELVFFKAHISFWKPKTGFRLRTQSESPVGAGLGGSSSLSVSIYKAFSQWLGSTEEVNTLVSHCANIEAQVLQTPTGVQDYYPAAQSGLNILDIEHSGIKSQVLDSHKRDLSEHFFVVYTGRSHHSGINNWQVLKNYIDGDARTRRALDSIREIGFKMRNVCLESDWKAIPELFAQEYRARMLLADAFSSPEIEALKEISEKNGASAFKICGAGGGGCVLVWADPGATSRLKEKVTQAGYQVLDASLV